MEPAAFVRHDVPRQFARGALLYFVVVGVVGVLLRARYVAPVLPALRFDDLVHAHSHVAYFGWASLALMAAIYDALPRLTGRPLRSGRAMRWQLILTHVATLGALVTFASGGYTPLSIVFSTCNVLLWYVFIWLYRQQVRGLAGPLPVALRYLHAAVALLFVSSLGTWLISALSASGVRGTVGQRAALNVFLINFTDGWLLLGILGLAVAALSADRGERKDGTATSKDGGRWAAGPLPWIVALTPFTFLADLVSFDIPAAALFIGLAARFGLAVPYAWFVWNAVSAYRANVPPGGGRFESPAAFPRALSVLTILALGFFVAKAVIHAGLGFAAIVPPRQLFVAYLHLHLLGFVSCGLMAALHYAFSDLRYVGSGSDTEPSTLLERRGRGAFSRDRDMGAVGGAVLGVGVVTMVAALALVGVLGRTTDSVLRAVGKGLLQAAFVFGVVAFIGIVALVVDLWRRTGRTAD